MDEKTPQASEKKKGEAVILKPKEDIEFNYNSPAPKPTQPTLKERNRSKGGYGMTKMSDEPIEISFDDGTTVLREQYLTYKGYSYTVKFDDQNKPQIVVKVLFHPLRCYKNHEDFQENGNVLEETCDLKEDDVVAQIVNPLMEGKSVKSWEQIGESFLPTLLDLIEEDVVKKGAKVMTTTVYRDSFGKKFFEDQGFHSYLRSENDPKVYFYKPAGKGVQK